MKPPYKEDPFKLGQTHAQEDLRSKDKAVNRNPYPEFGGRWATYNRGYNKIRFPQSV